MAAPKQHTNCRVCNSDKLVKYLDLGLMPMANSLFDSEKEAKDAKRYPLELMFCDECGLSQLSIVVDPSELYEYYTYRSSINGGYVKHSRQMAKDLAVKFNLNKDSFHIDVAGNDGALLKEFKDEIGLRVLNVDPAKNLCVIAREIGVDSYADFFNYQNSDIILSTFGKADLITATNVFAHVDNVVDFLSASKNLLNKNGVLVLEFPYLVDFIENNEFDTIYFEHLSYFSLLPIMRLCSNSDMKIIDAEKKSIHGGTIRVTIAHEESDHKVSRNVSTFVNLEIKGGYNKADIYLGWSDKVYDMIENLNLNLQAINGNCIGFGASAKGNTLLNSSQIDSKLIRFIADETPEKIGKYAAGTGIKIVGIDEVKGCDAEFCIILAWNFKDELMAKLNPIYKGKYLIPIPELICI
jgi:novobiocin biosynthesis protein NovU/D-mycarose 3-C-methyltransferase